MNLQKIFDNVLKLVKLLKPEFYNKMTWAVVIAGLSILSTTLIEKLFNVFLEINFNLKVTDGDDALIGFSLVLTGLLYHYFSRRYELREIFRNKKENNIKREIHDSKVFEKLDQLMSESTLKSILDWIGTDHSYKLDQKQIIDNFCHEASNRNYYYINDKIENTKQELVTSLCNFSDFLSLNFFVFPKNQSPSNRCCLYPDLNIDRSNSVPSQKEEEFYLEKETEMLSLIDISYEKYLKYRLTVKRELVI